MKALPVVTEAVSWDKLLPRFGTAVILGHRRMGKSGLGWELVERLHKKRKLQAVAVGMPRARRRHVPTWVKHTDTIKKLPEKAVIIIDEAALRFSARRSQQDINLVMAGLTALSGQRHQIILFIAHTARMLDVETIFDTDLIIYKLPSAAHVRFERRETAEFTGRAREALLKQRDPRKWAYVVDFHNGREGLLKNGLPSFWSEQLSEAWAGLDMETLAQPGRDKALKGGRK